MSIKNFEEEKKNTEKDAPHFLWVNLKFNR
jgi:hypothetical protein